MKGYLAHPVLARKKVREWEAVFEEATGIELINPFHDVEQESEEDLYASEGGCYDNVSPERLVSMDLKAVYDCDFTVAFVTGDRSYGTIMEIVYSHLAVKPVYIICTNGHENHQWLAYHATKVFTTPEQFTEYMSKIKDATYDN